MIQHTKALKGVTHSSKASGATPGGCARAHPPESDDATTPVYNSLNFRVSDHTRAEARGYCRVPELGVPKTGD
jgi:hypothetical protein